MRFKVKSTSRLFACQNPLHQGGGRKGLPKSFINRFTQVYMDKLRPVDILHVCTQLFPRLDKDMLQKIIEFTWQVLTHGMHALLSLLVRMYVSWVVCLSPKVTAYVYFSARQSSKNAFSLLVSIHVCT